MNKKQKQYERLRKLENFISSEDVKRTKQGNERVITIQEMRNYLKSIEGEKK